VGIAFGTGNRGANHAISCIANLADVLGGNGRPEAGPAAAGVEFGGRVEQRIVTADTAVDSFVVLVPVFAGEGDFGVGVARDVENSGRELFAPFGCGLNDPSER